MRSILSLAAAALCFLPSAVAHDFNGDGFHDLAIGVPWEGSAGLPKVGRVTILPGSATGAEPATAIELSVDLFGAIGHANQSFGAATAWGDFDGDGFADLAIGAPGTVVKSLSDAGRVFVVYGKQGEFDLDRIATFDQNAKGIKDKVEPAAKGASSAFEFFGAQLASGDFDGNGYDDLAIAAPGERLGNHTRAGVVHALYGSAIGLRAKGNQLWHQNVKGIKGAVGPFHQFGASVGTGDFNGDGYDDLAVSVPADSDDTFGIGRVAVIFGSHKKLRASGNMLIKPGTDTNPLNHDGEDDDTLVLACGDFDANGSDDIVVGVLGEKDGEGDDEAGGVFVVIGPIDAKLPPVQISLMQNDGVVPGLSEEGDQFGAALAVGDFDSDGIDDLAVGAPGEVTIMNGDSNGRVTIIHGSATGLSGGSTSTIDQETAGVDDDAEIGDLLGFAIAAVDFEGDGASELAVGVPGEDLGGVTNAGLVHVFPGVPGFGIAPALGLLVHQDVAGVPGDVEEFDLFGFVLGR